MHDFDEEDGDGGPEPHTLSYLTKGELSITDNGLCHERRGHVLLPHELLNPFRCMEVLDWGYLPIADYVYMLYAARHIFACGPRRRTKMVMLRQHKPIKAQALLEGSRAAYLDVEIQEKQEFLTPEDAHALTELYGNWSDLEKTADLGFFWRNLITSPIQDNWDELKVAQAKEKLMRLLKDTVPEEALEETKSKAAEYWLRLAGAERLDSSQGDRLAEWLRSYSPSAIKDAMKKAARFYRTRPPGDQFDKIPSFLTIAEQMIDDPDAENIHKLKGAVDSGSPTEAVRLLRTASYLGISPLTFTNRGKRRYIGTSEIRQAIAEASAPSPLILPPLSSGVWR